MATKNSKSPAAGNSLLKRKGGAAEEKATQNAFHLVKKGAANTKGIICSTDTRVVKKEQNPFSLVVDSTEGFIPLWDENLVLRWTFNAASLAPYENPDAIKDKVREMLTNALTAWGDAAPIRFTENDDNSDFEIAVEEQDSCNIQGCTLAQAFFPDAGRHQLYIFPMAFDQSDEQQTKTLAHELGHVFGLRHFFAPASEIKWPSQLFGKQDPFTIMNYGANSKLTEADRTDLKQLYKSAWNGELTKINGTPIKLVKPFHYLTHQ